MDQSEQMDFFFHVFDASLPRLGPGGGEFTRKALGLLYPAKGSNESFDIPQGLKVLDLGCGNGAQTLKLARHIKGSILAVDSHQPFLDELERRAAKHVLAGSITTWQKDMNQLAPADGPFDLIWAEGSLYNLGFEAGLVKMHGLLKAGGLLAATELTWLRPGPPAECLEFFAREYPPMQDNQANLSNITSSGYEVLHHFSLPESAWLVNFYQPLEKRLGKLRQEHQADQDRLAIIESIQKEIDIYRKYSSWYGYMCYLVQRG